MPVTSSPIDPATFAGLRSGEESMLERLFRDHYASLTTEAMGVLHDPTQAALTVERVFVCVWKERESFQTPEELSAFLHSETHDAAVKREVRRAGLHRMDSHVASSGHKSGAAKELPTPDAAWQQVVSSIHVSKADHSAAARDAASRHRHEAAEHMAAVAKPTAWILPMALVVLVLSALVGAGWWFTRASADTAADSAIASTNSHVLSTAPGQLAEVTLEDGSKVKLGVDSKLRVPSGFGEKLRALGLDGSATFTVVSNPALVFDVRTRGTSVKATGTTFTVRSYASDRAVTVRVTDGSVSVSRGSEVRPVAAGAALTVDTAGAMSEPTPNALEEALGWTDNVLVVHERPLRDVLPQLKQWYGLELFVKDSTLLRRNVTMKASLDSKRAAIAAVESSAGLVFGYEGKTMVLMDTAPTVPGPKKKVARPK